MSSEILKSARAAAYGEARQELTAQAFRQIENGTWQGELNLGELGRIPIRLTIPSEFPDILPKVYVSDTDLQKRIPHREADGKLCLAPDTGILIDASRPREIVKETLERARETLRIGLSDANQDHYISEYSAYWRNGNRGKLFSLIELTGSARAICEVIFKSKTGILVYATENKGKADEWAKRNLRQIEKTRPAFYIPLQSAFIPPDFNAIMTVSEIHETLKLHSDDVSFGQFVAWLQQVTLPVTVVFSVPTDQHGGRTVAAIRFEEVVVKGFRRGQAKASMALKNSPQKPVTKLQTERIDRAYLLPRGGSSLSMMTKTVTLVGCGAVGSHIARNLAAMGVGTLRIVDNDTLSVDNIYRHVLDMSYVGHNKAQGMACFLELTIPHIKIEPVPQNVLEVLNSNPDIFLKSDLIIVALGDGTLELRLNDTLGYQVARIHTWLEPLGIGGHVLVTGLTGAKGCFRCLFDYEDSIGLVNRSSFAKPGQQFHKSMAGCSGAFTPFSYLDAAKTALEATAVVSKILTGEPVENLLQSWFGDPKGFTDSGFALSDRTKHFHQMETKSLTAFGRGDCPTCQRKKA